SYDEAVIFFDERSFIHYLAYFSTLLFGQNDLALRLPFILLHIGSIILMYQISDFYFKRVGDRLINLLIFIMLPGVTSAAVLVNSATVAIFFTLLFIYLFLHKKENLYAFLLPLLVFVDDSFITLYLALVVYGMVKRELFLTLLSLLLTLASLYLYGFDMANAPKIYFFDIFAVYGLIFSPLLFLYFFYVLYRILIKEKKDIIWYISFNALLFSIILSFRQRILIEDFAPFVVIAVPLMFSMFLKTYRIRLPELRRFHKYFFAFVFASLVLLFGVAHLNKYLYVLIDNPSKHFAYKYHVAKELAIVLKKNNIDAVMADSEMQKRLQFYKIARGDKYILNERADSNHVISVTISYFNRAIKMLHVSKIHNL
nr:glycosyltransferase family 39 protein [Campylobacterota bacterium]